MPDSTRHGGVMNHYFAYPINYKGKRCYVFCRAMQDANKNRLYVHEAFIADNIKKVDTLQTAASQPHGGIALYKDILANVLDVESTSVTEDRNFVSNSQENSVKSGENTPSGGEKDAIEEMRELQQQIDGTLPKGHVYELGMPSAVLQSDGLPYLPIELVSSRLSDKSMQENHPFELSEIEGLVESVQNPLAVFRNATHVGSFVVLTEIQHNGRNFVAAIEANRRQGRIEINSVRSVYPKNNAQVANWIEEGLLEYADKKRMSEWFSKQQYNSADVRNLFRHSAKIVESFENPNIKADFSRAAAPFYSNARRAVLDIKQEKATPEQWVAMLKKNGG